MLLFLLALVQGLGITKLPGMGSLLKKVKQAQAKRRKPLVTGYAKCGEALQCRCMDFSWQRFFKRMKPKKTYAKITTVCPGKMCKCPKGTKYSRWIRKCMAARPKFPKTKLIKPTKAAIKKCMATPACKAKVDAVKGAILKKEVKKMAKMLPNLTKTITKQRKYAKKLQAKTKKLKGWRNYFKRFMNNMKIFRVKMNIKKLVKTRSKLNGMLKRIKAGKMGKRMAKLLNYRAMWRNLNAAVMTARKKARAALKAWRKSGVKKICNCTAAQKKPKAICPRASFVHYKSCKCPKAKPSKPTPSKKKTTPAME